MQAHFREASFQTAASILKSRLDCAKFAEMEQIPGTP